MESWIKLYRKFAEWEWFNISEMVHLFIYLLISANNEDGEWRGIKVKRGQLITGRKSLNESTGISEQKLRTCLKRLENTKEITIQSTNHYSIITICNYNSYQEIKKKINQPVNQQLTNNQPATNHKQEYKINKEEEFKALVYECDPLKYSQDMCFNFISYWTEKNKSGKMRFELEKVFEISKRLATWKSREKTFSKSEPQVKIQSIIVRDSATYK